MRNVTAHRTRCAVLVAGAAAVLAACGGGGHPTGAGPAPAVVAKVSSSSGVKCADVFVDGAPVDELVADGDMSIVACEGQAIGFLKFTCDAGAVVWSNDYGWGRPGGEWHSDASTNPGCS